MQSKRVIIGKIYANWCGHCQHLKPEWEKMKMRIPVQRYEIVEIEESEGPKLEHFKQIHPSLVVNGYPTIFKIHPNKRIEYYTGSPISEEIKKWVIKNKKNPKTKKNSFRKKKNNQTRNRKRNNTLYQ